MVWAILKSLIAVAFSDYPYSTYNLVTKSKKISNRDLAVYGKAEV